MSLVARRNRFESYFFFSSRRRHTRLQGDWSSDVCSSDLFLLGPEDQISVQLAHGRVKRRAIISPVVLDPASDNWNEHPRQILDRFIAALRQLPATKFVTNGLRCPPHHSICMAPRVRRKRGRLPSNGFIERAPQRPACLHLCHE